MIIHYLLSHLIPLAAIIMKCFQITQTSLTTDMNKLLLSREPHLPKSQKSLCARLMSTILPPRSMASHNAAVILLRFSRDGVSSAQGLEALNSSTRPLWLRSDHCCNSSSGWQWARQYDCRFNRITFSLLIPSNLDTCIGRNKYLGKMRQECIENDIARKIVTLFINAL